MQLDGNVPALFGALAAAKSSELWKAPTRNREVTVHPRKRDDGYQPSPYTFKYATLDELIDCTEKALAAQGLSVMMIDYESEGKYYLRTMLVHAEGGSLSFQRELSTKNSKGYVLTNQERGSELTYSQRYSYKLVLCLAADDDDDANAADGNEVTSKSDRSKPPEPRREQKPPARPAPQRPQAAPVASPAEAPPAQKPPERPPGRPTPANDQKRPEGVPVPAKTEAMALLKDLGYNGRDAGSERMDALIGKRFGDEITNEELTTFVTGLRQEKRVRAHLEALEYTGDLEMQRIQRDYPDGTDDEVPGHIRLMGPEELARALQSLEREAKIREVEVA